jgi:hypothetical protein
MTVVRLLRAVTVTSLLPCVLGIACQPEKPKELVKSAKFGVFFGGQVEERKEIPFELDAAKQLQGFRVEFNEPLRGPTELIFRIDLPKAGALHKKPKRDAPAPPKDTSPGESGTELIAAGETRFDHVTNFHPGDPLGLWNVRVVVAGKVVIDRPVEVFDPIERARLTPEDGGP